MKERPIIFSGDMVRAILYGGKTQTRRVVKPAKDRNGSGCELAPCEIAGEINAGDYSLCPYGKPGDRLWVREAHMLDPPIDGTWESCGDTFISIADIPEKYRHPEHVMYRASHQHADRWRWRPSIHMPRWASRITLEVTAVRVERLQEITAADIQAEGLEFPLRSQRGKRLTEMGDGFPDVWESINGPGSWEANPWVWVIEFKRILDNGEG